MYKTEWIEAKTESGNYHLVNGLQLAKDVERILNELDRHGYTLVSITSIVGGRWRTEKHDGSIIGTTISSPKNLPETCSVFGYSMTDGVLIVARRN